MVDRWIDTSEVWCAYDAATMDTVCFAFKN